MSLSDLASLGSFVSGVAVLISLIYLALQVRQTEKNQQSLMQQGQALGFARWCSATPILTWRGSMPRGWPARI